MTNSEKRAYQQGFNDARASILRVIGNLYAPTERKEWDECELKKVIESVQLAPREDA